MPVTFAEFAETLTYDGLPGEVKQTLRRSFLDTVGVAAVGSLTELSKISREAASLLWNAGEGAGVSRAIVDGRALSPAGAAYVGANMIDSIDAHDGVTPCKGHCGSAMFPALWAIADAEASLGRGVTGEAFMTQLAFGYEIAYRAGRAQHATCADYHTSGAWTAVGVGAAGARILGASPALIREAAGIGEYHGPRSQMMRCIDHPTMVRDGVGWGAPTGVTAAYLATLGFTGAPALTIEGEEGAEFWADLGDRWRLIEDTHYKRYPVCRWAHPAMDAVRDLMDQNEIVPEMIERVRVNTFHYATRLEGRAPQNLDELTYAIIFPVAAMIARGKVGLEELQPDALTDPEIKQIADITELAESEEYTRLSTEKRWADVELFLKDGRHFQSPARTPKGDRDDPLSDDEIVTKFQSFAVPVLGEARAEELLDLCFNFDDLNSDDFARLMTLIVEKPA